MGASLSWALNADRDRTVSCRDRMAAYTVSIMLAKHQYCRTCCLRIALPCLLVLPHLDVSSNVTLLIAGRCFAFALSSPRTLAFRQSPYES